MKRFILGCLGVILLNSCTSLQYRLDDEGIKKEFAQAQVATQILYVPIKQLNREIRVQSVTETKETAPYNIVFLHGSPSSLSAWRDYLKDSVLVASANLHAIDRPGYGYSDFGDALVSIDAQTKVIDQVVSALQLDNVIAIGTSYGGPVAARLAVENDKVKAVMMVSPAIDPENEKRVWASNFTQFWLTRWMVPTGYRVAGDEKTTHAQELASIEKDWSKVTVPVIHIHGDADELVPYRNVEYSQRVFRDPQIVTIIDIGHEIAWRRSDLVIPHIMEVIDRLKQE